MRSTVRTFCAFLMGRSSDRIATLSSSRATATETLCSLMAQLIPRVRGRSNFPEPQRGIVCASDARSRMAQTGGRYNRRDDLLRRRFKEKRSEITMTVKT